MSGKSERKGPPRAKAGRPGCSGGVRQKIGGNVGRFGLRLADDDLGAGRERQEFELHAEPFAVGVGPIVARIKDAMPDAHIATSGSEGAITRFTVRHGGVQTRGVRGPALMTLRNLGYAELYQRLNPQIAFPRDGCRGGLPAAEAGPRFEKAHT
jgi:hypothetical protein